MTDPKERFHPENRSDLDLDQALARIDALEEVLARVEAGLRLTVDAASTTVQLHEAGTSTLSTLEEMVLMVDVDRTIGYVNVPMARLLELSDRKAVLRESLSGLDHGILGEGTFAALVASALSIGKSVVIEREVPGLMADRLPRAEGARPVGDPILRFVATPMKGRVQISVQDVTRLRWLERTFSRFVSPRVIEQMLGSEQEDFLAMQRREITMLYVDLRGFTQLSQTLALPALQAMMHTYFERMERCVEAHEGTVGQFVGDQVVALFGAPVPRDDHALRALLTAVDMLASHREAQNQWRAEGWPHPGIGIGVSTGEVAVGNMGTPSRMYYTALGYWMNLGARLCGSADAGELLTIPRTHTLALETIKRMTSPCASGVPHLRFSSKGVYRFKNVSEPMEVLSVQVAGGLPGADSQGVDSQGVDS